MRNSRTHGTEDDFSRISALYDTFDESTRLESRAARIEFVTSVKYIEAALKPGMRILDLGAGTGRYSLYFAEKGYEVVAVELVKKHAQAIEDARTAKMKLQVIQTGVTIEKEVASDGMSELLRDKINQLSDEAYEQWVRYHLYLCEKPEFLGASNHLLFIAKK